MFDVGPLAFSPRFKTPTAVASSNSNAAGGHPAVSSGKAGQHNKSYDKDADTATAFLVAMAAWFIAAPARAHFQELMWGFAALVGGRTPMKAATGEMVPVEQGALMWVRTADMK
jgi:hypothetical protein